MSGELFTIRFVPAKGLSHSEPAKRVAALLRGWFGNEAGIAVTLIDGVRPMFPEEEECIRDAVPRRRMEFSTGRWCARQALTSLGEHPSPILVGHRREPLWPAGVIGTITHAAGLCAAVAVRIGRWRGVGIDLLEVPAARRALRDGAGLVASEGEERAMQAVAPAGVDPLALLFSAKESAIKAISAQLERFIDFREIRLSPQNERFEASCTGIGHPLEGWWNATDELIITAATFGSNPADGRPYLTEPRVESWR